jgi:hypothetical protein
MDTNAMRELDYGIAISVQTLVEAFGMISENMHRYQRGESIAYDDKSFTDLLNKNGVHHNGVLSRWKDI